MRKRFRYCVPKNEQSRENIGQNGKGTQKNNERRGEITTNFGGKKPMEKANKEKPMTKEKAKITVGKLIEKSNIPEKLIRAVIRQMGGWDAFTESAPDICRGGIDGGFNGFIFYSETEPFARRNRAEIAALASAQAADFGAGIFEMIRGFGTFRNSEKPTDEEIGSALYAGKNIKDGMNILNVLAWYAGEEVARAYCDEQ